MRLPSWTAFKSTCITTKGLHLQYEDLGLQYRIIGPDQNSINWEIILDKQILAVDGVTMIANPDATDFETSIKAGCNAQIGVTLSSFTTPGYIFAGDAVMQIIPYGSVVTLDYRVDPTRFPIGAYTNGGDILTQNSSFGDWLSAEVIDLNNVMGYGTGTILETYIYKRYLEVPINTSATAIMELETPYVGLVPPGCYLRITYYSTSSSTNVGVAINYDLHKAR